MKIIEDLDMYSVRKGWPKWTWFLMPIFFPCSWPIIIYRLGSWIVNIKFKFIRIPLYTIYFPIKRVMEVISNTEISEYADIAGGFYIAHVGNVVIVRNAKIGSNTSMHQGVTIGANGMPGGFPTIGDRVYFGVGCVVIGPVKVGNDVVIGANAVVTKDVPDDAIVGGVPAKILNYKSSKQCVHYRNKNM